MHDIHSISGNLLSARADQVAPAAHRIGTLRYADDFCVLVEFPHVVPMLGRVDDDDVLDMSVLCQCTRRRTQETENFIGHGSDDMQKMYSPRCRRMQIPGDHIAPSRNTTTRTVLKRIEMSPARERLSTYLRSRSTRSA